MDRPSDPLILPWSAVRTKIQRLLDAQATTGDTDRTVSSFPIIVPHGLQPLRILQNPRPGLKSVLFIPQLNPPDNFITMDSQFVNCWKNGSLLSMSTYVGEKNGQKQTAFAGALKWVYHPEWRSIILMTSKMQLSMIDLKFNEICSVRSANAMLCMEMVESVQELIVGCIGGIMIWKFRKETQMNLSITVFDSMRLFINNVSSEEWVSAILYQKKDRLLYAAGDNNLYVYDYKTGKCLESLKAIHDMSITHIAYQYQYDYLITISKDDVVKIWNKEKDLIHEIKEFSQGITGVCLPPIGSGVNGSMPYFFITCMDGSISLWNADTGHCDYRYESHYEWMGMEWIKNNYLLTFTSKNVNFWCLNQYFHTFSKILSPVLKIQRMNFGTKAEVLVTAVDGSIRLLNVVTGKVNRIAFPVVKDRTILSVCYNASEAQFWVLYNNGDIGIYSEASNPMPTILYKKQRDIGPEKINALTTITLLDGKTKILAADSVGQLLLLSHEPNDTIKFTIFVKAHSASVNYIQTSPDHTLIVSAANDYTVKIWKVDQYDSRRRSFNSMSNLSKTQAAHGCNVKCVYTLDLKHYSPIKIHTIFQENTIQIYAVTAAQLMVSYVYSYGSEIRLLTHGQDEDHRGTVNSISSLCRLGIVATCSDDKTVKIWDLKQNILIRELQYSEKLSCATFLNERGDLLIGTTDYILLVKMEDYLPLSILRRVETEHFTDDVEDVMSEFDSKLDFWEIFRKEVDKSSLREWHVQTKEMQEMDDEIVKPKTMEELERFFADTIKVISEKVPVETIINELGQFPNSIIEKYFDGTELQRFHRIKHRSANYEFRKFSSAIDIFQKLRETGTNRQTHTALPSWLNEGEEVEEPSPSGSKLKYEPTKAIATIDSEENIKVQAQEPPEKPALPIDAEATIVHRKSIVKRGRLSMSVPHKDSLDEETMEQFDTIRGRRSSIRKSVQQTVSRTSEAVKVESDSQRKRESSIRKSIRKIKPSTIKEEVEESDTQRRRKSSVRKSARKSKMRPREEEHTEESDTQRPKKSSVRKTDKKIKPKTVKEQIEASKEQPKVSILPEAKVEEKVEVIEKPKEKVVKPVKLKKHANIVEKTGKASEQNTSSEESDETSSDSAEKSSKSSSQEPIHQNSVETRQEKPQIQKKVKPDRYERFFTSATQEEALQSAEKQPLEPTIQEFTPLKRDTHSAKEKRKIIVKHVFAGGAVPNSVLQKEQPMELRRKSPERRPSLQPEPEFVEKADVNNIMQSVKSKKDARLQKEKELEEMLAKMKTEEVIEEPESESEEDESEPEPAKPEFTTEDLLDQLVDIKPEEPVVPEKVPTPPVIEEPIKIEEPIPIPEPIPEVIKSPPKIEKPKIPPMVRSPSKVQPPKPSPPKIPVVPKFNLQPLQKPEPTHSRSLSPVKSPSVKASKSSYSEMFQPATMEEKTAWSALMTVWDQRVPSPISNSISETNPLTIQNVLGTLVSVAYSGDQEAKLVAIDTCVAMFKTFESDIPDPINSLVIPQLGVLEDEDSVVRSRMVEAVESYGQTNRQILVALLRKLTDPDFDVRLKTLKALQIFNIDSKASLKHAMIENHLIRSPSPLPPIKPWLDTLLERLNSQHEQSIQAKKKDIVKWLEMVDPRCHEKIQRPNSALETLCPKGINSPERERRTP